MIVVYPKANTGKHGLLARSLIGGNYRHGIFQDAPKPWLVAEHNAVGATVNQDDGIDAVAVNDPLVRCSKRADAALGKRVDRRRQALPEQPFREPFLRKVRQLRRLLIDLPRRLT